MPSAIVSTATHANAGCRRSSRAAYRMSCARPDHARVPAGGTATAASRLGRRPSRSASAIHVAISASTRRSASSRSHPSARAASYAVLACVPSSSATSRSTPRPAASSACVTRTAMSGMADPRNAIERGEKVLPDAALLREHLAACGGQPVVAAAALAGALDPAALDQAAVLEAIERGVERGGVKGDGAARSLVDQAADVVAVTLALVEERQDQDLGAATFELALEERRAHMWRDYISAPPRRPAEAGHHVRSVRLQAGLT